MQCWRRHVSQKAAHKAERDAKAAGKGSFAWAWLLDERAEERARGVTVDVAAAFFETPARLVRLLDAPGHQDFVPNMIAGMALQPVSPSPHRVRCCDCALRAKVYFCQLARNSIQWQTHSNALISLPLHCEVVVPRSHVKS